MFNMQLRRNIKQLDLQIGELTKELNGLNKDTKYDIKMRTLEDLIDLRSKLAKNQKDDKPSDVMLELDKQIEELTMIIKEYHSDVDYSEKVKKLDELTKVRGQLSEVKSNESNAPIVISVITLLGGIGTTLMVLKHEETNVITSKAFDIAKSLFRGR